MSALVALTAFQFSCTSIDLDEEQDEINSQAHQISAQDSIVLCPLVGAVQPSADTASVHVVWAGYPPNDDRLQLMHAKVSQNGDLLQSQSIAILDGDLEALQIRATERSLDIEFVESDVGAVRYLQIETNGVVHESDLDSEDDSAQNPSDWQSMGGDESCETSVSVAGREFSVFRAQVDGQLSLFVQALPVQALPAQAQ